MSKKEIDDYLQEGIYGVKELHPDEKKQYLGTFRERVILVVTKAQVRGKRGLNTFETILPQYPNASLLINGHMNISFSKPYRELAKKHHIPHTFITHEEHDSIFGLVLTADHAIDKEDIQLPDVPSTNQSEAKEEKTWLQKWFGL